MPRLEFEVVKGKTLNSGSENQVKPGLNPERDDDSCGFENEIRLKILGSEMALDISLVDDINSVLQFLTVSVPPCHEVMSPTQPES